MLVIHLINIYETPAAHLTLCSMLGLLDGAVVASGLTYLQPSKWNKELRCSVRGGVSKVSTSSAPALAYRSDGSLTHQCDFQNTLEGMETRSSRDEWTHQRVRNLARLTCWSPSPPTYLMTLFISSFSCIIDPCSLLDHSQQQTHSILKKYPWNLSSILPHQRLLPSFLYLK